MSGPADSSHWDCQVEFGARKPGMLNSAVLRGERSGNTGYGILSMKMLLENR